MVVVGILWCADVDRQQTTFYDGFFEKAVVEVLWC